MKTSYSYDGDNRQSSVANNYLTEIVNPYSETTSFSYDALDREEQKTLANGVTVKSTFDAAGRKVLLEQRKADTTALAIYTATYDAVGIRTATQELDGSVNDYSYDATYQLTNETRSGTNALSTTFTYDPTGNRLTQDADGTLTTSTYDAANQLLTTTTISDVTTFTYDANGNQTIEDANGSLTTYTWDAENRMTGADDGTNTESFIYAGDGQRRKKSTSSGDINYLWDEENILEELDGSDSLIAHYTDFPGFWGGLSSQRLATNQSAFYLFDLQSSNRLLLDASAATDNEYLYKAFGEKVISTGNIRNPFQFQGMVGPYFDANNRTWMRARIYNPITGRWDSPDPIGFDGDDWNLYEYVASSPTNWIDADGLQPYPGDAEYDPYYDPYRGGPPPTRSWPSTQPTPERPASAMQLDVVRFLTGKGPRSVRYGPKDQIFKDFVTGNPAVEDFENSAINQISHLNPACRLGAHRKFSYGPGFKQFLKDTVVLRHPLNPNWTISAVGGWIGNWRVTNVAPNGKWVTIKFYIRNDISITSLTRNPITRADGLPNKSSGIGGTVHQHFYWSKQVLIK